MVAITDRAGLLGESSGILVSNATLRELSGYRPEAAGVLQLTCGARTDIDALGDTLRQSLRQAGFQLLPASHEAFGDKLDPLLREGWAGQRLDVSTWEDESSFLAFVTVGLAALAVLVGAIVLAIVMVGLFVCSTSPCASGPGRLAPCARWACIGPRWWACSSWRGRRLG